MRLISLILLIVGLALALYSIGGESAEPPKEIATFSFDRLERDGSGEALFEAGSTDGFVRLKLSASLEVAEPSLDKAVSLTVKISDRDGTLLAGIVSFSPDNASSTGDVEGSQNFEFEIQNAGPHALTIAFGDSDQNNSQRPRIRTVSAALTANKYSENENLLLISAALIVLSIYLFVRSFFRRRKNKPDAPSWGRGDPDA